MTPPTRKSQRKRAIPGKTNKHTASISTAVVEEGNGSSGSGATGSSSKRKGREGDHLALEQRNVKKAKRDHQALIAEKLNEIKRIINEIETTEELGKTHLQLLDIRKHVQNKLVEKRAYLEKVRAREARRRSLEVENNKPLHPLLNQVIMDRLVKFITDQDLPACRLVCREWNQIVSSHLKKICWTNLTFDTTNSNSQDMPLKHFISDIRPGSTLFPLTKFTILLYKVPPPITKFFDMYSEHIKKLDLRYQPPTDDAASQQLYLSDIVKFLLPAIPNCESLYLTNFSCQVFTNTSSKLPKRMNLKYLEVEMNCKCTNDEHHLLGSNTFLTKLIIANQSLDTFNFIIDFKQFSDVITQRLITMLLSCSNVVNLKHIALKSENLVRTDWADSQPASFQLKSLELKNIAIVPLRTFLQHHADSLEKLTIEIEGSKWDDLRRDFVGELLTTPKLKQLKSFSVMCLEDQEEALCGLLTGDLFPKLEKLKFFNMNENFVHAHSLKINNNNAGNNNNSDSEDDEPPEEEIVNSENHIQVKHLELMIDDSDSPSDYHFLRHSFYGIQHLTLTTNQSRFITPLWTCGFQLKSLDLRVLYDDPDGNEDDEFYIQHLDTIVTGFSVNDCERIYQHVMNLFHSTTGFQLDTFNVDWIETICKDKEYPSIRNLNCLQKLSITCSRNSSRLTEVTLATLLLCIKSLTALNISNCSISQKFICSIREQLAPGFFMEIDGIA